MKMWLPAMVLSVASSMSIAIVSADARGAMGGTPAGATTHAMAGFPGRGFGFHHGFGLRPHFLRPADPFLRPHFNFGAGFVSHRSSQVSGAYGDYDDAYDDDYGPDADDDIENLHFRVQEPFGPGDIGRPPVRVEEDAPYDSERMDAWHGYGPGER